jgi:hypothetical protein
MRADWKRAATWSRYLVRSSIQVARLADHTAVLVLHPEVHEAVRVEVLGRKLSIGSFS